IQTRKCHSFYVKVNGTVEEFHGIFNQGLILGMTYTGRIDHTAVIFRKGGKIFIDDRLVTVASCYGGSQIIRDNGRRNTFKITHGVLASPYQVFLALRPYGFAVGIMTERK